MMPPARRPLSRSRWLLAGLAHGLSNRRARALGRLAGEVWFRTDGRRRRRALASLRLAFPEASHKERRQRARASFRHALAERLDSLAAARLDPRELCRRWHLEGWEQLLEAERSGPGRLTVSARLGSWTVAPLPLAIYRPPLIVVATSAAARRLQGISRPHLGLDVRRTEDPETASSCRVALEEGASVHLLLDLRGVAGGSPSPRFFGTPCLDEPLAAELAWSCACPAVPLFARMARSGRYRIRASPPIPPPAEPAEAENRWAARLLEALEAEVRRHPESWPWMRRLWEQPARDPTEDPPRRDPPDAAGRAG